MQTKKELINNIIRLLYKIENEKFLRYIYKYVEKLSND